MPLKSFESESEVLKKLKTRLATFDGVIIETTGLADPAPVAQTFFVDPEVQQNLGQVLKH